MGNFFLSRLNRQRNSETIPGIKTWTGANVHEGAETFSGAVAFTGDVTLGDAAADTTILKGRTATLTAAGSVVQIDATTSTYAEGLELRYNMADWVDVATFTDAKGMYLRMETNEANNTGSVVGEELYGVANNVTLGNLKGLLSYAYVKGATAKTIGTAYGVQGEITWDAGAAATTLSTEAAPILAKITGGNITGLTKVHGIIVRAGDMDGTSRTYGNGILIEDDSSMAGTTTWTTGINLTCPATTGISITNATTGINILADSTSATNNKDGIYISKDLTNATAAGALSATDEALLIQSVNASSAAASGALSLSGYLTSVQQVNSTAVASADVYNASAVGGWSYSASTSGTGTATNSSTGIEIDYNITETAGTLANTAFSVAKIDFDSTGTPDFANGSYNLLDINGSSNGSSINASATTTFSGLSVDLSGMVVTDADLTLYGAYFKLPAASTSTYATLASYETFKIITTQDTKTITLNSRNYAATTGDIIGFQSKPAGNASGTQTVYGGQISPRFNDNVDGAALIGLQIEPILKGATILALSGDMRALDLRLTSEGANTVGGNASGITFYNLLKSAAFTGGVHCMVVENNGDTQPWSSLIKVVGALGTNTVTTASDKSANAKSGTLKVYIDGSLFHIQLYAD